MSTPNISREAEALDALLDRRPYSSFDLDPRDAELADQIQEIAGEGITSDARFYRQLEQTLLETAEKRSRRRWLVLPTLLVSLSGSAVLIVLVMLSGLLVWKLLGQPSAPGASESATPVMALPADQATPIAAVQPSPEPVMVTETVVEPLEERAGSFLLKVPLPDGPTDVPRYRQVQGGEPLTAESAQSMAAQLGVEGPVFGAMGEIGVATYQVQDGKRAVLFFGATTSEFNYSASYSAAGWAGKSPLPFEEQAAVTTQWLEERSLFDPAYQVEPLPTDPSVVMIVQKLESGNLYEENLYGPRFYISISPTGQVLSVISQPVFLETDGRLSIRPAAEVWESLKTGELPSQTFFQTLDFSRRRSLRTWYRTYPVGETVDVYGVANVLQPVDPNQATNVQVNDLSLLGDSALVAQIPVGPLLRVWGVYQVDEAGYHWLDLQGWEVSPVEEVHLTGTLVRENSVLQFKTEAGEWINLPDLPPDAPEGEMLSVSGAQTGPNEVQWRYLQTVIGQDDNVQIGSLPVPGMPTEPVMPALPLPETGFQPGDKVELRGYVQASQKLLAERSEQQNSSQ